MSINTDNSWFNCEVNDYDKGERDNDTSHFGIYNNLFVLSELKYWIDLGYEGFTCIHGETVNAYFFPKKEVIALKINKHYREWFRRFKSHEKTLNQGDGLFLPF
jgi:hypothetical protein